MSYPSLSMMDGGPITLPSIKPTDNSETLEVDFLFPNGILVPLHVHYFSPLDQIKAVVWRKVENYPLTNALMPQKDYSFLFINKMGEKEEVLDESQNLEELQPFLPVFQFVRRKGDKVTKTLDKKINNLIGRGLHKQESFQAAEIHHFTKAMSDMCKQITTQRRTQTPLEKFMWRYPVRLRSSADIPDELKGKISDNPEGIAVDVAFTEMVYKIRVDPMDPPKKAVAAAVKARRRQTASAAPNDDPDLYILKVIGLEEYIYGDYPLIQFKYVYQSLVKSMAPQFLLVLRSTLPESTPAIPVRPQTIRSNQHEKLAQANAPNNTDIILWNIEMPYRIQIKRITKIQLVDGSRIKLYAGLYHGGEALCEEKETEELVVQDGACEVSIGITFGISVANLPHAARLCFALYTIGTNTKRKDLTSWVNIPVFDFKLRLQRGDRELPLWPQDLLQQPEEHCVPLGCVALNSMSLDATFLTINFPDVANLGSAYLVYPQYDKVLECASQSMEEDGMPGSPTMKVTKQQLDQLNQALFHSDQLFEQDKELIWLLRYEVRQTYPNCLAKVLQSVKWNSFRDVAKMTALLQIWAALPVDYALEILDHEYPDHNVRYFAVNCLDAELSDDDVCQYMLQLVQALKFETHLNSHLAKFLLRRALKNQHLGHKLFWLLRSESHNPAVTTQYSLILQCYLEHNPDHLEALSKQQEALKKLCAINLLIKESDIAKREEATQMMQQVLQQPSYKSCLSNLFSPLSPLYKLSTLKVKNCRFMKSKKRPLWLTWTNSDLAGPDVQIMYKNGDDLRQDMLTLQILQVMDDIWQAEGLDFRMNPYLCMATDLEQGMIEVVSPAETMADIQHWYKAWAFDKKALFEWLKYNHPNENSLDQAVEEFLLSCAGYCVATYVLGIGDRHNDNIMVKTSGQLFHIDFGHFLGNFKSKFHIKRERVPFVLTSHFIYVITKGNSKPSNSQRFQAMCEQAFLLLRRRFPLLMSLFMMMVSCGIPQLSGPKDAYYLHETLVPHLTEKEALAHFKAKYTEALRGSWKTSINFWVHMMAK
ncbi:phosphatidylinositol 4,5-bisphosphate 3-kinase catalytic subunit delta isoform [Plakobranchus ocellatus]|uniref:phosphatidylinositol 3-kinase n=1 Tax=Plakobranchus ocellatus TaxID=259542 RepID=A0AAV4DE56_9GAST|nr:phosphatidylinositol 4,5-bisphosphate 3-kinase catalytic subunit delta isoform [Plakobranchus ocellatus]